MEHYFWNDWYVAWGWFLWFGIIFLLFSGVGNWGYSYRIHRRFGSSYPMRNAHDILLERYSKGEIDRKEFYEMKEEVSEAMKDHSKEKK